MCSAAQPFTLSAIQSTHTFIEITDSIYHFIFFFLPSARIVRSCAFHITNIHCLRHSTADSDSRNGWQGKDNVPVARFFFESGHFCFLYSFTINCVLPPMKETDDRHTYVEHRRSRMATRRTKSTGNTYYHLFRNLLYDINFTVARKMLHQTFTIWFHTIFPLRDSATRSW